MTKSIYDFTVSNIDGKEISLSTYRGKPLLVVNTASKCGFTPQYKGLEELYQKYKDKGFAVLGFPCNQFGAQEPGDESEIKNFCSLTYDVTFPMFSKVEVNGDKAAPLYQFLKEQCPGILGTEGIKWNFTKFLVDQTGSPVKRFAPNEAPDKIAGDVENLLK